MEMIRSWCMIFLRLSLCFLFSDISSLEHRSLEKTSNLAPSSSQEDVSDWEARLELARVLSYLKKYDESLREYQRLLEVEPNSANVRMEMVKILFYQDKTDAALEELAKIPPQNIDDQSWVVVADIYRKKKNYPKAEQIYLQYLEKFPQDDKVRLRLAELLSWQKRYDESLVQYRTILKTNPNDVQVRRRYAQVLTWANKEEEAIQEWRKSLSSEKVW